MPGKLKVFILIFCYLIIFSFFKGDLFSFQQKSKESSRVEYVYHEVRRGESLEVIARKYGLSVEELKKMNNLRGERIVVGQRLIVGVKKEDKKEDKKREVRKEKEQKEVYHVVKRGETLEKISKIYGVPKEEIKKINNLKTEKLAVGQKLLIRSQVKDQKEEKPKLGTSSKSKESSRVEYVYHEVRRGESLEVIARKYGLSVEELKKMNNLRGERIVVGQRLIVGVKKEDKKEDKKREVRKEKELAKDSLEERFKFLEERFKDFSSGQKKDRRTWLNLANEYRKFYLLYPSSPFASKAILRTGDIYFNLYRISLSKKDLNKAIECYRKIAVHYFSSQEVEEAYYKLVKIYQEELKDFKTAEGYKEQLRQKFPKSAYLALLEKHQEIKVSSISKEKKSYKPVKPSTEKSENGSTFLKQQDISPISELRKVTEVSPITGKDYTRVIINLSGNFEYQTNILKGDGKNPPRIYVDLYPAVLDSKITREIELKDTHLKRVRVGQFDKNVVRVVLDLNSLVSYKIFKLKEPFQLVLDLTGEESKLSYFKTKESLRRSSKKGSFNKVEIAKVSPSSDYINLARQFGLGVRRIVIDPGHGGEDPGAVGPTGLKEKDVNLMIAKFLEKKLKETFKDMEVVLTRNSDYFIPLIKRPALANTNRGDIFISIHTNASPDPNARGIEVYYLNFTTDPEAMRVAALENAASDKSLSDLQDLIKAILSNTKLSESKLLAEKVHNKLLQTLSRYYPDTTTRGVKYAPFLVLVGTRMPAILVEVGFITNPIEEGRLKNQQYLELIAEGIAKGIEDYIQSLKFSQISR